MAKDPEHFLFIRCGNFQLGAVGRPAIAALVVLVVGIVSTKVLGLW
jgi:hypothetical protein